MIHSQKKRCKFSDVSSSIHVECSASFCLYFHISVTVQKSTQDRTMRAFIPAILLNLSLRHCDSIFLFRDLEMQQQTSLMHWKFKSLLTVRVFILVCALQLHCCGLNDYNDWENNIYFNCSSPGVEKCGVPFSCCQPDNDPNVSLHYNYSYYYYYCFCYYCFALGSKDPEG